MSESMDENSTKGELGLPLPKNHNQLPRFCNLVRLFYKLAGIHGKGSIQLTHQIVLGFINSWKKSIGDDLYPAVRLWYPQEDEKLNQLRKIKDSTIGKMIVHILDLPDKSPVSNALINSKRVYYAPYHGLKVSEEDDLAIRIKRAIDERYPVRDYSSLTIHDVTLKLEEMANATKEKQEDILRYFMNTLNSDEFYWLIKIIQNRLNIKCSEKTFLKAFHPNADEVYLVNKSLKTVCLQLWSKDFIITQKDKSVKPLSFFCPMLAKYVRGISSDFQMCVDLMDSQQKADEVKGFYIEEKIDGERVQLHWVRDGDITKFYSRRSVDHTESYQGVFDDDFIHGENHGYSRKEMKDLVNDFVETIILDGEVVAWDPKTNDFCGQSKVRELTYFVEPGQYKHMVFIFDIIYLNGVDLTNKPLSERKNILGTIFNQQRRNERYGKIELLPYKHGFQSKDISEEFQKIVTEMSEGLVIKNPNSTYCLNGRTNDWIKLKPDYIDGFGGETLDLLIVGAYRGSGKFQNQYASYLCAMRDERVSCRYVSLTRVASGICMAIRKHINQKLEAVGFHSSTTPAWLDNGIRNDSSPDIYVPYDKSVVVEIKYSEIISPNIPNKDDAMTYGIGYSLRFPRYVKLREDKSYESTTSIGEFMEINKFKTSTTPKVAKEIPKKRIQGTINGPSKRIRESVNKRNTYILTHSSPKSYIFSGKSFYICGDIEKPEKLSELQLACIIRENGGIIKETYDYGTCAISDQMNPKAIALIYSGVKAIYHPFWLFDSITAGKLITPDPIHLFYGSLSDNGSTVDKYGFSLNRLPSSSEIERIIESADLKNYNASPDNLNLAFMHWKLTTGHNLRILLFARFLFYIDPETVSSDQSNILTSLIQYAGGNVVTSDFIASHIITEDPDLFKYRTQQQSIVTSSWVISCWFANKIEETVVKGEVL